MEIHHAKKRKNKPEARIVFMHASGEHTPKISSYHYYSEKKEEEEELLLIHPINLSQSQTLDSWILSSFCCRCCCCWFHQKF